MLIDNVIFQVVFVLLSIKVCLAMALKTPRDKIKTNAIKKYDNQNLSKEDYRAENKKKSKLRVRKSWSQQNFYELDFCAEINSNKILLSTSSPEKAAMTTYYNPGVVYPNYSMPYTMSQWDHFVPSISNPTYTIPVPTVPVPVLTPPLPVLTAPVLPYSDVLFTTTYSPIVPYVADTILCTALDQIHEPISSFAALTPVTSTDEEYNEIAEGIEEEIKHETIESLDYLTLPKNMFPAAKMLTLDPNPIIDELCKIKDINKHTPWILDLEFGVPRTPISRPIAVYDVQFNNIHCKNTPGAVHPGFESCNEDFKKVFLFYYDCMVSVWYRGYIRLTNDDSVKNFQNWLIVPMQALGMCWP